ncbi:permease-like cell division protein FtsX [Ruminococcaceae bacterium OttesenSCG-928-O06]|nr:permease-like cell division protein FtsX [Ruminococcaceae bacterium OttesenSCG-928-O06]
MRLGSFSYLVKQGWKNMGANRLMTLACIGVLTACFLLTGVAVLLTLNVGRVVDYLADQNEIVVTLLPEVEEEQAAAIGEQIKGVPNVQDVVYESKDDAFNQMQSMLAEYGNLLEGFERIFPARYLVTVQDLTIIEDTNARLAGIAGVEKTYVPVDLAGVMIAINNAVTYGGWGIVAILALVSVIIISNTIRLTVFARRKEISIMKYVGATNAFIRLPFFVEGMTVGIIAGLISSGIVCAGYYFVMDFLNGMYNVWILKILDSFLTLGQVWYFIVIGAVVAGILIGGVGTASSVRKHLKV